MPYKEAMQTKVAHSHIMTPAVIEKPMLEALKGRVAARVPMWLMRQAGRYLPEYRALRAEAGSFLNLCYNPSMAAEITLQPLRRYDFDAAILFSDILVIPHALGQGLAFVEGEGPQLPPLEKLSDIENLDMAGFEQKLAPVYETIRILKRELATDKTLIGFAGAPWTIACYMLHGRGGGTFDRTREMAAADPKGFQTFLMHIADVTARYLVSQIKNGADTVQLFDSWAGLVPDSDFESHIIAPTKYIIDKVHAAAPDVPVIGFPRQAGKHYAAYAHETGISALGLDPQADIKSMPQNICLQGNLAPEKLLAGGDIMRRAALDILQAAAGRPFVFNLGHGVIKETPPEHVAELATLVRNYTRTV